MVDFYQNVPKTLHENLAYRIHWRKRAEKDAGVRRAIRAACKHDILFYFNFACWIHEPRIRLDNEGKRLPHILPFITRPHQDEYFKIIDAWLGLKDIIVKKCRDEGFSWGAVHFAKHDFAFNEGVKVGLVSSTEKKSDDPGNMDSLGAKLDWALGGEPIWLVGKKDVDWERNLNKHSWVHLRNGNSINAFAASGDTGRSGRYLWFLLDEFGSREWQDEGNDKKVLEALFNATDSKLIISTPEGQFGEFHRIVTEPQPATLVKIEMNWKNNPIKARGLYEMVGGRPVAADPVGNPLSAEYDPPTQEVIDRSARLRKKGFDLNKGQSSPWYDDIRDRSEATLESVAKNVDADFGGSVTTIFDDEFYTIANKTAAPPQIRGTLTVSDDGRWTFGRSDGGQFLLWCSLDHQNRPPHSQYVVCADFAHGRGGKQSANSALHVIDLKTKEQVAEYATKTESPAKFTETCLGVCRWFYDAYFAWEHNQPGNVCTDRVLEVGYGHYFKRKKKDVASKKITQHPGFWTDDKTKEILFSDLVLGVKDASGIGGLVIRSKALIEECTQYIRDEKGKIVHSQDGPGHGDRVIAIGVGVQAMKDRPVAPRSKDPESPDQFNGEPPYGTMAWREWKYRQQLEENDDTAYAWDDRSTSELRTPRHDYIYGAA